MPQSKSHNWIFAKKLQDLPDSSQTGMRYIAYKQLVPLLEYCAPIWDPHNQCDIQLLEMVQHRVARFILNKPWRHSNSDSVTEMLQYLKWPTLQIRRKYLRLTLLFRIINNLVMIPNQYFPVPAQLSSTRYKLFHYQSSNDTYIQILIFSKNYPRME